MDYDNKTLLDLKKICRERGLRLSGNKDELIIRLMEDDEENLPNNSVKTQVSLESPYPHPLPIIIGLGIILYGFFRIGFALLFSIGDEFTDESFLFESLIAWVIGMTFITSGVLTMMGYRNGLFIAIGVLLFSGLLSIIFHNEMSPLSNGLDGEIPLIWSIFCSGSCLFVVTLPILVAGQFLEPGWPPAMQPLFDNFGSNSNSGKVSINCSKCDLKLLIPREYSGQIKCPNCDYEMTI